MSNILTGLLKELKVIFRDKKFLTMLILYPFLIPAFIIGMGYMYDAMQNKEEVKIGVNYELKDTEKEIFEQNNENTKAVYKTKDELKTSYENGEMLGYIVLEDNTYYLYFDLSSTKALYAFESISNYLEQYNKYLASNYLVENNINPDNVFNIVKMEVKDQAKEGTNMFTVMLLPMVGAYLVMILVYITGFIANDIIAGEKERGTFETVLTFPLKSTEIIGSKLLAIVTGNLTSGILSLAFTIPALSYATKTFDCFKDMKVDFGAGVIALTIVVLLILSFMVGILNIFLVGKSKSFKEAQSKSTVLAFLGMLPGFMGMIGQEVSYLFYCFPIVNGSQLINDVILGNFTINNFLVFAGSSILVIALLLVIVSKQYKDEKALF